MHRCPAAALVLIALAGVPAGASAFRGTAALEFTRHITAFGPHPSGSAALARVRGYIESQARSDGWTVSEDSFTAQTPGGAIAMKNIVAHLAGHTARALVFTGHYDTRARPGFLGANDGGSSAGFLLELARALRFEARNNDIYLVWFDGEEAVKEWSDSDSTYGSRHLAAQWANDGTLQRIKALINVDMIGDKDLELVRDDNSTPALVDLVWQTAQGLGFGRYFGNTENAMDDDHIPFRKAGVPALDVIDFDYGPNNSYWHTNQDTMDKLSAHSFEVVGTVLMEARKKLD